MIFVRASAKYGRGAYDRIAAEVGKAERDVSIRADKASNSLRLYTKCRLGSDFSEMQNTAFGSNLVPVWFFLL